MSIKYYYVNDLNKLYNAAIGNKTDGGEYHMAMMEAHDNLEEYIQKIEHWRDTALQLSKNLGTAQNKIDNLEQDYVISNRELLILQVEINRLNAELARLTAELAELNDKAVFIQFENEDELPSDIQDDVYSAMFNCSHVDGVRLFPYIEENCQKYFFVMLKEAD